MISSTMISNFFRDYDSGLCAYRVTAGDVSIFGYDKETKQKVRISRFEKDGEAELIRRDLLFWKGTFLNCVPVLILVSSLAY